MPIPVPAELWGIIFEQLPEADLRSLRMTCRHFECIASRITDRTVVYPISKRMLLWGVSQIPEKEELRRAYVLEKLANPQKASSIRTLVLTGWNCPAIDDEQHRVQYGLIRLRGEVIGHLIRNAHGLTKLNIATDWGLSLPILRKISYLSNLRTLRLQVSPLDVDQTILPEMMSLWHLELNAKWHPDQGDQTMERRFNFCRLPNLSKLILRGYAPSQFLDAFEGSTSSLRRCVLQDLVIGPGANSFFRRFSTELVSLVIIKTDFQALLDTIFYGLQALKFVDVHGFTHFQSLACPRLSYFSYSVCKWSQGISMIVERVLPRVARSLKALELRTSREAQSHVLSGQAVRTLVSCQHLQYVLFSGHVYIGDQQLIVLKRIWSRLDFFVILQPFHQSDEKPSQDIKDDSTDGRLCYRAPVFQQPFHWARRNSCVCGVQVAFQMLADPQYLISEDDEFDETPGGCSCSASDIILENSLDITANLYEEAPKKLQLVKRH